MALAGVAAGAVWAWLAPASPSAVIVTKAGKRIHEYLGNEGDHYFDSAGMMIGLLVGLAVVSAVLVWQWRQRRGPAMVIGLTAGGVALAAAATGVGAGLVRLRYGHTDIGAVVADHKLHYITEAPAEFPPHTPLQGLSLLLVPPASGALTYVIMPAASADDYLGVTPSVPETVA